MDPRELFRENIALIDRVLDRVCRRARLFGADAEDFASSARLALLENDGAILRRFEGRSSLATFLSVVFEHLLADQRVRQYGKWTPSAEAARLGAAAVLLERLLHRDRRDIREATAVVQSAHPELTAREVAQLAARLPYRAQRPHRVDVDDMAALSVPSPDRADSRAVAADVQRLSDRAAAVVRDELVAMPAEDRAILRFRFGREMSIADISRIMRLPQRPLYRRMEALLARLRTALGRAGIDAAAVEEIIGGATQPSDFGLAGGKSGDERPTMQEEPQ